MKKFLKITLSLLLLLVIGYFGYSYYQKRAILKGVVHTEAESVLKIGINDIKKTLLLDLLSSPGFYWRNAKFSDGKKENDTIEKRNSGIELQPYSIVFYSMKNVENTYFTSLKINDSSDFEIYISDYLKTRNTKIYSGEYKYALDKKSKLVLAWTENKLAIAFSLNPSFEKLKSVFDDVLLKDKVIYDTNNAYLKKLIASENHITYLKNDSEIDINFEDGKAVLSGLWLTEKANQFKSEIKYNSTPNAALQFNFDANFQISENRKLVSDFLQSFSFFNKSNLSTTVLTEHMDGNFGLTIHGSTIQTDTIVTYEYDDNFEKVAVKSLQEKDVPKITMNLASNDKLNDYLKAQGALENGVLTAVPLYTFYVQEDSINPGFSTVKQDQSLERRTGSYFFNLDINFQKFLKDVKIPKSEKLPEIVKYLQINARQAEENKVVIKGNLIGKSKDINIITQLFVGLKEQDSIQ